MFCVSQAYLAMMAFVAFLPQGFQNGAPPITCPTALDAFEHTLYAVQFFPCNFFRPRTYFQGFFNTIWTFQCNWRVLVGLKIRQGKVSVCLTLLSFFFNISL